MKLEVISLEQKNDDLEARSRHCKLRIIGVKERREDGKHAPELISQLLKDTSWAGKGSAARPRTPYAKGETG